jgi:hypothetical protein
MRHPFLCLLAVLTAFLPLLAANPRTDLMPKIQHGRVLYLPATLETALERDLPDYRLPTREDYRQHSSSDSAYAASKGLDTGLSIAWNSGGERSLPFICWGDFNGDRLTDVALMLLPKKTVPASDPLSRGIFVIFNQTSSGYQLVRPWKDFPAPPVGFSQYYIQTKRPGYILPFDGGDTKIYTRTAYVEWVNDETSACVFYFAEGEYHQVWTGD